MIEKRFVDILLNELNLPTTYGLDSQGNIIPSVFIASQNIKMGTTDKLQIVVSVISSKLMASKNYIQDVNSLDEDDNPIITPTEFTELSVSEIVQIDMMSRNNDARDRRYEIVSAINSIYSIQQQEKHNFKIFKQYQSLNNSTLAEGSSQLNRYTVSFVVMSLQQVNKATNQYYDSFTARGDSEDTIDTVTGAFEIEDNL